MGSLVLTLAGTSAKIKPGPFYEHWQASEIVEAAGTRRKARGSHIAMFAAQHRGAWTDARSLQGPELGRSTRVVVHLPDDVTQWPPACFLVTALRALRADPHERMLVLVGSSVHDAASALLRNRTDLRTEVLTVDGSDRAGSEDSARALSLRQHMDNATRVVWAGASRPITPGLQWRLAVWSLESEARAKIHTVDSIN